MNNESNHDPIKLVNKNIYLNSIILKQRYDMMSVNDFTLKRGLPYPNNTMFKIMSLVKSNEDGLINIHHGLNNICLQDLTARSLSYKDKIDSMMDKLETINHTKLHNNITKKENKSKDQVYNKIRIVKKPKEIKIDDNIIFPRIEYKSPLKKKKSTEVQTERIKIKRPTRKVTVLNRSDRRLSTILKKTEPENKPYTTLNYTDASTILTTDVNQNTEKDEYYHMIVDNEVQLYKKYIIAPGQTSIPNESSRANVNESSKLVGLQYLLDKKDLEQYNDSIQKKRQSRVKFSSNVIKNDLAGKIKTSRNVRKTRINLNPQIIKVEERNFGRSASVKKGLEYRRNIIDNKLKPLKFYVMENLKKLNRLNADYKSSFNQFNEYFEHINYDNEIEKNILFEEVVNK
jgi:hypothetical protein